MKDILKSWKTSVIGVIALLGLSYKIYTSGGLEVEDFLLLIAGVGFIGYKENYLSKTVDPEITDKPDTRG